MSHAVQARATELLIDLAEMAGDLARQAYEAAKADKAAFATYVNSFLGLGRCVRLSILAEHRLRQGLPEARIAEAQITEKRVALEPYAEPLETEALEREEPADRPERIRFDTEREVETESDGFPMTPMGRAEALEAILARNPALDPEGRRSAQIIEIKSRLRPEPERPPPASPGSSDPPRRPALNRAERRREAHRLRRASG